MPPSKSLTYESTGVSIRRGDDWVDIIRSTARRYFPNLPPAENVIGGFAGLYPLGNGQSLAACADGVGTKLLLAEKLNLTHGLGQDLVAMNLNDLVTVGARPLFFLDYIACSHLDAVFFSEIINSMFAACASCGCMVLGGETAEMPALYKGKEFDLAGFCVGLVEDAFLQALVPPEPGDTVIGLHSSGFHSNGYSLVNKLLEEPLEDPPTPEQLLAPTRLYVNQALAAWKLPGVKAMAHITGGGPTDNINRVLGNYTVNLDYSAFPQLPVYDWLTRSGVSIEEQRMVFNLGIGFAIVCRPGDADGLEQCLRNSGETPVRIGTVG